jgi:ribosomal protein L32E
MLKIYDKLEDVPEALREHYKLIEGKYVAEVTDDHPIKLNNVKLLNEKTTAETKASGLETANAGLKADLESAKSHSLPRGHRAVPVAEFEAMDKLKEHGTATEIATKLTEHKTLSEKVAKQERETNLRLVAKELGYNADAFVQLPNLPDMEIREKDGKKTVVAKVKDGETVTEKPAAEFVEATFGVFLPALKAEQGVKVLGSASDEGSTADPYKWAKDFSKDYVEQSKPVADPFAAFNQRQSA